jgi:hypothetical protein
MNIRNRLKANTAPKWALHINIALYIVFCSVNIAPNYALFSDTVSSTEVLTMDHSEDEHVNIWSGAPFP